MNTDTRTVFLVVAVLGLMALAGLGFIGYLAVAAKPVPDSLISITMFAAGAVAGLLSKTSTDPPAE